MKKILITNHGKITVRIIRACRKLGLKTIAIHSTIDRDSLHAKLADESICIKPSPNPKNYLKIPTIISTAEIASINAIHPNYGFLSKNTEFTKICAAYKIK